MSLEKFYSLRNNFTVIGLTGRSGGGGNDICEILTSVENPFKKDSFIIPMNLHVNEIQKFNICKNLLIDNSNKWRSFLVIKYRDILLLFFLNELCAKINFDKNKFEKEFFLHFVNGLYDNRTVKTRRFGQDNEDGLIDELFKLLLNKFDFLSSFRELYDCLNFGLRFNQNEFEKCIELNGLFFTEFSVFAKELFLKFDQVDLVARQLFLQDVACNLRSNGTVCYSQDNKVNDTENIYTVAAALKNLIKINRKATGWNRIVIDSLKNSLEINYFRERYAGFYLIASSRDEASAKNYLIKKIERLGYSKILSNQIFENIKAIDEAHYQTKDFKIGNFTSPDLENCIQKADYYIHISAKTDSEPINYNQDEFRHLNLEIQLLKFLALVQKPGIVTPSAIERSMQLAFSSKYNSGCISRQVGAVITDSSYSVKSIGWNEVPQGQTPCSLRSLKELVSEERRNVYSDYEKNGGNYSGKTFKEKVNETLLETYSNEDEFFNNLDGHNCPYCFKDFHNSFEGKENQVHTRSLHAEENAMLQISKFGGQGLNGGILFTTASPCELCSKKAFQLGIKKVFYIDPYPGIAREQILKAGNIKENNPQLYMFHGAVGRGYFKLYEPYMSIKDETYIRTNIKPKLSTDKIFQSMKDQLLLKFPNNESIIKISSYEELLILIENRLLD